MGGCDINDVVYSKEVINLYILLPACRNIPFLLICALSTNSQVTTIHVRGLFEV